MCKYCEKPEPIDNISNCPTDRYIEEDLFANGIFLLKVASKVNIGIGGTIPVLATALINYCPICGRKLEDTKNV